MARRTGLLIAAGISLSLAAAIGPSAIAAPPTTAPSTQPAAWDDIDQRMVFFTIQLASVETSVDAANKALKSAGYKISLREDDAGRFQKGNDIMDRNAGGPVKWDEFYGRTAEKFFYNPAAPPGTLKLTVNVLRSNNGVVREPMPNSNRPPQFDYIYRANANAKAQAEADVNKLAGKVDQLLARRRQLEAEQSGLWCKIAFRPAAGRELLGKPLYRFDLKTNDTAATANQNLEALRAAMDFLRLNNKLIESAEKSVDDNQAAFIAAFQETVAKSRTDFDARLMKQPTLVMDAFDTHTTIGKLEAVAKRMNDVAKNTADAYKLALDGDKAADEQRKNTFRGQLQESLMIYAEAVMAGDECVTQLAKEWKIVPDLATAATMPELPEISPATPQNDLKTPEPAVVPAGAENRPKTSPVGTWKKLDTGTIFIFREDGTISAPSAINPNQRSGRWTISENKVTIKLVDGDGVLTLDDGITLTGNISKIRWRLVRSDLHSDATKGFDPASSPKTGSTPAPSPLAKLTVHAHIDGSDDVSITQTGAVWKHLTAKWPTDVKINGVEWVPSKDRELRNSGNNKFLPAAVNFAAARIAGHTGRGTVTMETSPTGLELHIVDGKNGAADCDVEIEFSLLGKAGKPAEPIAAENSAIKIGRLESKRPPELEAREGLIVFQAPANGKWTGGNGVLLNAPTSWEQNGTVWQCEQFQPRPYGLKIIHPFSDGQIVVTLISNGAHLFAGGDWHGRANNVDVTLTPESDGVFPLNGETSHQVRSELAADGNYQLFVDGKLVARATIQKAEPLLLEGFTGPGVPKQLAKGQAAIDIDNSDRSTSIAAGLVFSVGADSKKEFPKGSDSVSALTIPNGATLVAARWGGGKKWADVTQKVKDLVAKGENFTVTSKPLDIDPAPGWTKTLQLVYSQNGKTFKKSIPGGKVFRMTDSLNGPAAPPPPVAVRQGAKPADVPPPGIPATPDSPPPGAQPEDNANETVKEIHVNPTTLPAGTSIFDF